MVKPIGQSKKDTKTRILDAADAIFVRRGIDGARMQEIADKAGVNKSLLHYYFTSKAELARAVWLRIAVSFAPGILEMLSSDLSLDDKIDRYVDAYHTLLTRYPYLLAYMVSEGARRPEFTDEFYSPERRQAARRMMKKLSDQINEQVKKKKMMPVSAEQFFVTLASSCMFPFAAQSMMKDFLGFDRKEFLNFLEQRRVFLPEFLKRALRR
jgi:TetR/AcrR family transcriptional regulator